MASQYGSEGGNDNGSSTFQAGYYYKPHSMPFRTQYSSLRNEGTFTPTLLHLPKTFGVVETFHGSNQESSSEWLRSFKIWAEANKLDQRLWPGYFAMCLRGNALCWWTSTGSDFAGDWRRMERSFKAIFNDDALQSRHRRNFELCDQLPSENVREYSFRLNRLATLAGIEGDERKKERFLHGLQLQLKALILPVVEGKNLNYGELVAKACHFESIFAGAFSYVPIKPPASTTTADKVARIDTSPGEWGSMKEQIRELKEDIRQLKEELFNPPQFKKRRFY